jgi:zinc transport system permease protein
MALSWNQRSTTRMDDFLMRALLGGFGVALAAGPLGTFIVWRRMAYFGDTLAHSGLLGVMLGALLRVDPHLGVVVTCLLVALALVVLQRQRGLATDTLLGILAHATLSLGLVTLAFLETVRVDLVGYLFGDILAINAADLYWIWSGGLLALSALAGLWRPLLAITVHEELARVEGVAVFPVRLAFMLLIAIVIAVAMKVVGILLITSLLIIPAAAARRFARSPEIMAALASLFGGAAVGLGLWASLRWDTPAGPSVVVAATALFALGFAAPGRSGR